MKMHYTTTLLLAAAICSATGLGACAWMAPWEIDGSPVQLAAAHLERSAVDPHQFTLTLWAFNRGACRIDHLLIAAEADFGAEIPIEPVNVPFDVVLEPHHSARVSSTFAVPHAIVPNGPLVLRGLHLHTAACAAEIVYRAPLGPREQFEPVEEYRP